MLFLARGFRNLADLTVRSAQLKADVFNFGRDRYYASGSSYNLDLTLCYTDWEVSQGNKVTEANLKMYRWSGSSWADQGTVTVDQGNNCVTKAGVTPLSGWTLGDGPPGGEPTALTLARFTACSTVETWFLGETRFLALVAPGATGG